jgi:ribosomal protein L16 Arg81 hydroxylase
MTNFIHFETVRDLELSTGDNIFLSPEGNFFASDTGNCRKYLIGDRLPNEDAYLSNFSCYDTYSLEEVS